MSHQVLRRRSPIGAGLEADLAAVRQEPGPVEISTPSNDLNTLVSEGESFIFDAFTHSDAWELGHLLHAKLTPDPRPVLINISLANGLTLYQSTTGPGIAPDNERWVARKRNSVMRWGVSTWLWHCKFEGDEAAFAQKFGFSTEIAGQYAIHGGGVPIRVKDVEGPVAVVVVSGLKQDQDHGVIMDVVKENWEPIQSQ